jgi:NADPH-dependent curcumin reductase CurA
MTETGLWPARLRLDFVNGLERAPEAFIGMLEGRNFGKLIIQVGA